MGAYHAQTTPAIRTQTSATKKGPTICTKCSIQYLRMGQACTSTLGPRTVSWEWYPATAVGTQHVETEVVSNERTYIGNDDRSLHDRSLMGAILWESTNHFIKY
jgi:hypothetical protein